MLGSIPQGWSEVLRRVGQDWDVDGVLDNGEMETVRLRVRPEELGSAEAALALALAAGLLRAGQTVAIPTETVYGLAANALDAEAVGKIFAAKERPGWDPLIVHVSDRAMLERVVVEIPEAAERLMEAFWPGPLTLLLPRSAAVPDVVTAGRPLVGVRMPAHAVAREVIALAGVPLAAPSANRFGHTSPTTAEHVLADLDGRIAAVVDSGPTECGVESTVVDATQTPMVVYRPGAVTVEQIRAVAGEAEMFVAGEPVRAVPRSAMPAPGVGLRHYAPKARVELVAAGEMLAEVEARRGERVGVMLPTGWLPELAGREAVVSFDWGRWEVAEELAKGLFAGLRWLDGEGVDVIVCPVPEGDGLAAALRDRLGKAASRAGVDD